MKNKILSLILALSMALAFSIPVFANPSTGSSDSQINQISKFEIVAIENIPDNFQGIHNYAFPCNSFNNSSVITSVTEGQGSITTKSVVVYEKTGNTLRQTSGNETFKVGQEYIIRVGLEGPFDSNLTDNDVKASARYQSYSTNLDAKVNLPGQDKCIVDITYIGRTWKQINIVGATVKNGDTGTRFLLLPIGSEIKVTPTIPTSFKEWKVVSGNLTLTEKQKRSKILTFTVPNSDVMISAVKSPYRTELLPLNTVPIVFQRDERVDSVEKIKAILTKALKDEYKGSIGENIEFYDVKPLKYDEATKQWTSDIKYYEKLSLLDENYSMEILLPYPKGTNKDDYRFFISHLISADDVETPTPLNTDNGILLRTMGTSPFAIAYEKVEHPVEVVETKKPETTKPVVKEQVADTDASFPSLLLALPVISMVGITIAKKGRKQNEE